MKGVARLPVGPQHCDATPDGTGLAPAATLTLTIAL
jgi:hypothetical protein